MCFVLFVQAQHHINLCKQEVISAEPQVFNDKTRWYKIVVYNASEKSLDALEWEARFYNKFNELLGVRKGVWSSGDWINPISPGKKMTDRELVKDIGDADKVYIKITKAHFVGGKSCD